MKGLSAEFKVGIFALAVMGVLAFMTFKVGGLEWAKKRGYSVDVHFNNISGLDEKTRVKVAGVDAGIVERVELDGGRARIHLMMNPGVVLYRNAEASIKSAGLLGDKYLDIRIGTADNPLMADGGTITNTVEVVDFDDLARKVMGVSQQFMTLADNLNQVLGTEESKASLRDTIANLRSLSEELKTAVDVNDKKLRTTLDDIDRLANTFNSLIDDNRENITSAVKDLREFSGNLKKEGPDIVKNLGKATDELKAMVEENRPSVKHAIETVDNIAVKMDKGEGTLGKLLKDDTLYDNVNKAVESVNKTMSAVDRFKTFITFQTEYLTKPKESKGYFNITFQPKPDRYYILGVVQDPLGMVTTKQTETTPPGTVVTEDVTQKKIEFTAQFAKRFGNAALRAGLTENTFGVGADYFFMNDRGKITADIWDFSNDEASSKHPHLRAGVDFFLFKHVFLSAGADNLLNKRWKGGYVGGGIRFEDEDLKYLLGSIPRISTQ